LSILAISPGLKKDYRAVQKHTTFGLLENKEVQTQKAKRKFETKLKAQNPDSASPHPKGYQTLDLTWHLSFFPKRLSRAQQSKTTDLSAARHCYRSPRSS
jgi:hypothetical protein